MQRPTRRRAAATALTACSLFAAATVPAAAMTVTFVRHAESQGNASGFIDTSTPGPHLTNDAVNQNDGATGEQQALDWAATQCPDATCTKFDALYASTMIRTQETAAPFATKRELPVTVLGTFDPANPQRNSGVQEISAGIFEGLPEGDGIGRIGYILAPLAWTLGLQFVPIPGGENGLEFNERVTNALTDVESETEDTNGDGKLDAAVFSHGATIMMWTMMNVDNPNLLLIVQHPLNNTDTVVVEQNGEGGWTLKEWAGESVGAADYPTKMLVNVRDLIVAPQKAVYDMRIPVLTPDLDGIVSTGVQGIKDVGAAGVKFVKDSLTDTVDAITAIPGSLSTAATQVTKNGSVNDPGAEDKSAVETSTARTAPAPVATKLATGSKTKPLSRLRDRVTRAADKARNDVESSVKKVREATKSLGQARTEHTDRTAHKDHRAHRAHPKRHPAHHRSAA